MSDEEFDLIKNCVRIWRRRYARDSDEEYYGVAWEHLERARKRWNGHGSWILFARQRIIYGLMSEYRSTKRRLTFVTFNPEFHGAVGKFSPALDYIDEFENKVQMEVFSCFAAWKREKIGI